MHDLSELGGGFMHILKIAPVIVIGAALTLPGCASRASAVAPLSVDASEYYYLSCTEAKAELEVARQKEATLTRKQNNAATGDAVGVFLVLVPASSVFGGDVEGELALAKGQTRALETAVRAKCRAEAEDAAQLSSAQDNFDQPAADDEPLTDD